MTPIPLSVEQAKEALNYAIAEHSDTWVESKVQPFVDALIAAVRADALDQVKADELVRLVTRNLLPHWRCRCAAMNPDPPCFSCGQPRPKQPL